MPILTLRKEGHSRHGSKDFKLTNPSEVSSSQMTQREKENNHYGMVKSHSNKLAQLDLNLVSQMRKTSDQDKFDITNIRNLD